MRVLITYYRGQAPPAEGGRHLLAEPLGPAPGLERQREKPAARHRCCVSSKASAVTATTGTHECSGPPPALLDLRQKVHAAHAGHVQVGQDQVEGVGAAALAELRGGARRRAPARRPPC